MLYSVEISVLSFPVVLTECKNPTLSVKYSVPFSSIKSFTLAAVTNTSSPVSNDNLTIPFVSPIL